MAGKHPRLIDTNSELYRKRLCKELNEKHHTDGFISAGGVRFNSARMRKGKMQIVMAGEEDCAWQDVEDGQLFFDPYGTEITVSREP